MELSVLSWMGDDKAKEVIVFTASMKAPVFVGNFPFLLSIFHYSYFSLADAKPTGPIEFRSAETRLGIRK